MTKRAYHYTAKVKGDEPTRFYVSKGEQPSQALARAFAGWAHGSQGAVTVWIGNEPGEYRIQWFDGFADTYRETQAWILEERR